MLTALNKSKFRLKFRLSQKDRDYIATKGLETIRDHTFQFINARVATDFPKNDGKQTPMRGHPVFIAQHATATCCRGCIQKWHRIEKGRVLNDGEIDYVVELIMGVLSGSFKDSKDRGLRTITKSYKKRGEPVIIYDNLLPLSR